MEEKEGDPRCEHVWAYDSAMIATYPPISHKICSRCGRLEHEQGTWGTGPSFDSLLRQFHAKDTE